MDDKKYYLASNTNIAVSVEHADRLIALGDGSCALLYLYALRKNGAFSIELAAKDLKRTPGEIKKAADRLTNMGLFSGCAKTTLPLPAEEMPEYSAEDIAASAYENGEFPVVVAEIQRIMGKTLSGNDLKTLFGIYDYLKLPAEVIVLLVCHCVEVTRERLGPGRLPSMRTIEKESYIWFNREIMTLEQAEDYLKAKKIHKDKLQELKPILQINGRNLTATEQDYADSWLSMGFDLDAIAMAYDKTVVKTGGLQWKYMNSILTSWHGKNLHTVEDIISGDGRGAPKAGQVKNGRDGSDMLRKILDKSNN